jgi:hypothetical protein
VCPLHSVCCECTFDKLCTGACCVVLRDRNSVWRSIQLHQLGSTSRCSFGGSSTAVQLYSTFLPQVLDKVFETARRQKGRSTDVEALIACAKITKSVIADGLENDFVTGCRSCRFDVASPLYPGCFDGTRSLCRRAWLGSCKCGSIQSPTVSEFWAMICDLQSCYFPA